MLKGVVFFLKLVDMVVMCVLFLLVCVYIEAYHPVTDLDKNFDTSSGF